uniref:Keratin 99 n=1 Tax=Myripristis murdjan TaxID=586833 RepID=A0A667X9I4_9TELE
SETHQSSSHLSTMSVVVARSRLSSGMQLGSRMSSAFSSQRALSMYGGAEGFGTRMSQSIFSSGGASSLGETVLYNNEKVTMQNLNDRLASYLDKVRSLETANRKLELQIKEYLDKKGLIHTRDFTGYFATITDLRAQILRRFSEHQQLTLQVDNARLAADDFKMKYEAELNIRLMVEADMARLRGVLDSLTLARSDLESQIEGLKEELVYIRRTHEEDMQHLRVQQSGSVNVEVDCTESSDLTKVLTEVREQYEALMLKNQKEVEKWFQSKVQHFQTEMSSCTVEVKTFQSELSELKKTYQSTEINLQAILSQKQCLEQNLAEIGVRYSGQLSQLQVQINSLETELQQLTASIQQQVIEYKALLDIKMRLELEIAEYRRLLDGEGRMRRVKTIVEEIVDGKVVATSVDTQVQDIQ